MTSSIKWEPIEDLKAMRDMLERFARPVVNLPALTVKNWQVLAVRQPIDIYETQDTYVAKVDVPGLKVSDLEVTVTGSKMTIGGQRQVPEAEAPKPQEYVHRERPAGKFSRTLIVPEEVDVARIGAKLENGVLTVTMPKKVGTHVKVKPEPAEPAGPAPAGEA